MKKPIVVQVVVDKPLKQGFDYLWNPDELGHLPKIGNIVEVPFGRTSLIGVVIKVSNHSDFDNGKLKPVLQLAPLPPFDPAILRLMNFASQYYIHYLGETILPTIPRMWKKADKWKKLAESILSGKLKPKQDSKSKHEESKTGECISEEQLNQDQTIALKRLRHKTLPDENSGFRAILLQGQTGSGKTAVYLNWLASILKKDSAQVLLLVPEINLTPQLERRVRAYFPNYVMAVLHSGLTEKKRGIAWHDAMTGNAQIILGTRLAALTPIPNLKAIVVDEEHDPSYKQQEGTRYSARDLAVWRAHDQNIPILLASATPSLETWLAAKNGRYELIRLDQRAQGAKLPKVYLINMRDQGNRLILPQDKSGKGKNILSNLLVKAIGQSMADKKQSLILINRRGYAPALSCGACNWLAACTQCSSYMVLHKAGAISKKSLLSCHHCGLVRQIPEFCPECGNADLRALGQGTQKIEDVLLEFWPNARILRIDTDSSKSSKGAEKLFQAVHQGSVDMIVGTQMIAKGHDYQNVGLVAVLDADSRLYSQDFRAAERLFAQLIQVAGRAGRSENVDQDGGAIYIETEYPEVAIFQYLLNHDVDGFLEHIAHERSEAQLPPYAYQGLIHAEGKSIQKAIEFLADLKKCLLAKELFKKNIKLYDPVPKAMMRVAGSERAQLLIESENRKWLQEALEEIDRELGNISQGRISKGTQIRWLIERDPILI